MLATELHGKLSSGLVRRTAWNASHLASLERQQWYGPASAPLVSSASSFFYWRQTLAKTRIMSDAKRQLTFVLQRLLLKILITSHALWTLFYDDNREDIVGKLCLLWDFR